MKYICTFALLAYGCSSQPSELAPAVPEPTPLDIKQVEDAAVEQVEAGDLKSEVERYLSEGDVGALARLSASHSVFEINKHLRGLQSPPTATDSAERSDLAQGVLSRYADARDNETFYTHPLIELDASGQPHVAFIEARVVNQPDSLGNSVSWKHAGFYFHQGKAGAWEREKLPPRCYKPARLLVPPGGGIGLLCIGANREVLLAARDSRRRTWTITDVVWDGATELLHGADADYDSKGSLHVVWSPWQRDSEQRIYHRVKKKGSWSKASPLPGVKGRNLTEPRLRALGEEVAVVAAGQEVFGKRPIALFEFRRSKDRWSTGRQRTPVTSFESFVTSSPSGFLVGAQASSDQLFVGHTQGDSSRSQHYKAPRLAQYRGYSDYADIAAGPDDAAFVLYENSDQLLLVRGTDQKAQAMLFARSSEATNIKRPRLAIHEGRIHAIWTSSIKKVPSLHYVVLPIPSEGFGELSKVVWRSLSGRGLGKTELIELGDSLLKQAHELEAKDAPNAAIESYVYLLANIDIHGTMRAINRLACLQRKAVVSAIDKYMSSHRPEETPGWEQLDGLRHGAATSCLEVSPLNLLPQPHR